LERYAEQLIQEEKLKMLKKLFGNFRQLIVKTTVSSEFFLDLIHTRLDLILTRLDLIHQMRSSRVVIERLAVNSKDAKVLSSIPTSSDTVEFEGRQMKQC
jgi:hypothetical protein